MSVHMVCKNAASYQDFQGNILFQGNCLILKIPLLKKCHAEKAQRMAKLHQRVYCIFPHICFARMWLLVKETFCLQDRLQPASSIFL